MLRFCDMKTIGIVTVLYNSEKVLPDFFKSLANQTYKDFKLFIIDNNSQDKSLLIAKELAKDSSFPCEIFEEPENWGVAKGNNIGIKAALEEKCKFILLSNNDTVLSSDSIQKLLDGMVRMRTNIAVPKIFYYDTKLLWYAGGKFDLLRGGTIHFGQLKEDSSKYNSESLTQYAPTCFMLIKSCVFDKVGLMDEDYFVYYDDTDFVWRATKKFDEKIAYIPSATLLHKESSSTKSVGNDFKLFYSGRNFRYFILKNYKGIRKLFALTYSTLHTATIKKLKYNKHQLEVFKRGIYEGSELAERGN